MIIKVKSFIKLVATFMAIMYSGGFSVFGLNDTIPDVVLNWDEKTVHELHASASNYFIKSPRATSAAEWETMSMDLRAKVMNSTGAKRFPSLPLHTEITGIIHQKEYRVEKIYFQTRPDVYATANLYVPEGQGTFPAVLIMMGHSNNGKIYESYQILGQSLARNGYVALCIDPWGSGERSTEDGKYEYHGANLGATLLSVGETLMGMQLTDNMRAIDLLESLPYVNRDNIGATGASGGGNQTMWLAAMDNRIKAAVPVVSVGSFQSYVVNSNCICELWLDGLCHSEEFNILGLIAPRALLIANGLKDANPSFYPREMMKTYVELEHIYNLVNASPKLEHVIADVEHGYNPIFRRAMQGWFDLHLKGVEGKKEKEEIVYTAFEGSILKVFEDGKRNPKIVNTLKYVVDEGDKLKKQNLLLSNLDKGHKQRELLNNLRIKQPDSFKNVHRYVTVDHWERVVIETQAGNFIPLVHRKPKKGNEYAIIFPSSGKKDFDLKKLNIDENKGLIIVDLWGIGEKGSPKANKIDGSLPRFHTLSRSMLWLGETIMGTWVQEINVVTDYISSELHSDRIEFFGDKEISLALLFASIYNDKIDQLKLINTPISYIPYTGVSNYYNMSIYVPKIVNWGDLSLAVSLSHKDICFLSPKYFSGADIDFESWNRFKYEVQIFNKAMGLKGRNIVFDNFLN